MDDRAKTKTGAGETPCLPTTKSAPMRTAFSILISVVFVTAGCSTDSSVTDPPGERAADERSVEGDRGGPYTVEIEAEAEGSSAIQVAGETNLPDAAIITLSASRSMLEEKESEVRAANLATVEVPVRDGVFSGRLALDESDVLVGVGVFRIDTLSNEVTVCAEFRTGESALDDEPYQQDQSVIDEVGRFGERLEGSPNLEVFGSATDTPANWIEVKTTVPLESSVLDEIGAAQHDAPRSAALEGFCLS